MTSVFDDNASINKLPPPSQNSLSYEYVVKELIDDMKQNKRDLQLLLLVFRDQLTKHVKEMERDIIFPHISDVYDFNVSLLSALEDIVEMSQKQAPLYVGACSVGT